jgi:hypothetical protein
MIGSGLRGRPVPVYACAIMAVIDPTAPDTTGEEPRFPDPRLLRFEYDWKRDTLHIFVADPGPALSIDLGAGRNPS